MTAINDGCRADKRKARAEAESAEFLVELLAAHDGPRSESGTDNWRCACGELMSWPNKSTHRHHVARVLAAHINVAHVAGGAR